jgi:hypothetical protein
MAGEPSGKKLKEEGFYHQRQSLYVLFKNNKLRFEILLIYNCYILTISFVNNYDLWQMDTTA